MEPHYLTYLAPLIAVALILWRGYRAKPSNVRLGRMWIMPVILTLLTLYVVSLAKAPPLLIDAAFLGAALLGGAVGWLRARHMALSVHPETGTLTSAATPLGTLLILALFALRYGLKLVFPEMNGASGTPGHVTQSALWWTDGGLLFAAGMIWGRAITVWLRARPLLDAHRAGNGA